MITRQKYQDYINVLKEELIPAMGCTEPIAIAYAGAIAREHLGCLPERVEDRGQRQYHQECKKCYCTEYRRSARH